MDTLIETGKKHPIMEMRIEAYERECRNKKMNNKSPKKSQQTSPGSSTQKQVIRGITFFNAELAQMERKIEQNERKQVFKLLPSVEQAVLKPDASLIMS